MMIYCVIRKWGFEKMAALYRSNI